MFGCIVAGRLVQTNLQQVDVNKYVFELPDAHNINHIVVFLLGTIPFEPGFGATVHLLWPNKNWQMLGALSNDKPSAIFRLKTAAAGQDNNAQPMDTAVVAELGISIEPIQNIEQQLQQMRQSGNPSTALVPASAATAGGAGSGGSLPLQVARQFAERTMQSLFDYATSFATRPDATMGLFGSGAPVQVLPVKAFEDWYNTFLRKVQRDPAVAMQ
ncbi:hypothetical protein GGI15_000315 [Coemansia interrupta]|uniref:Hikeshi-like domain-containing protein n=1 Tax=Coemansia interrupta TaxID=1126814 RepID=A0A9W8LMF9_9FUNG|nr:hypothetical protein GGI15_000315 [Coemansia interrupta]